MILWYGVELAGMLSIDIMQFDVESNYHFNTSVDGLYTHTHTHMLIRLTMIEYVIV